MFELRIKVTVRSKSNLTRSPSTSYSYDLWRWPDGLNHNVYGKRGHRQIQ